MTEHTSLMEPMLPGEGNAILTDLVFDLIAKNAALSGRLHPVVGREIGRLIRSMNCYYSNLIEGHNTTPRDIDRALAGDYSTEPEKRALQKEAEAHIAVQAMIDSGDDPRCLPATTEYILWLHKEFCDRLPPELLQIENPDTGKSVKIIPGHMRDGEVSVGRHMPPLHQNLARFMTRFEEAYNSATLSKAGKVIAAGAAHHRLLWIHPFYDGNGRVARLMSYAMLLRMEAGSTLWSVARGLARNVAQYKKLLEAADSPRQGDRDGRGSLSEAALVEFCKFFLEVAIDQIDYMSSLLDTDELSRRIRLYCEDEIAAKRLPKGSDRILREALLTGEFERGKAPDITGYKERQAREVVGTLLKAGLLVSDSLRAPVRLGFPLDVLERWFPRLYPAID